MTLLTLRDFSWSPGMLWCWSLYVVVSVSSFASFCKKKFLLLQCRLISWVLKVSCPQQFVDCVCRNLRLTSWSFSFSRCHPRSLCLLNATPPSKSTEWLEMGSWLRIKDFRDSIRLISKDDILAYLLHLLCSLKDLLLLQVDTRSGCK